MSDRLTGGRPQREVACAEVVREEENQDDCGCSCGGDESIGKAQQVGAARAPARPPPRGCGVAQQAVDATEQEELALAAMTRGDVGEQLRLVAILEQVRQPPPGKLVRHRDSSSSSVANRFRPRRVQLFTEPSGTPSLPAIWLWLRSSK